MMNLGKTVGDAELMWLKYAKEKFETKHCCRNSLFEALPGWGRDCRLGTVDGPAWLQVVPPAERKLPRADQRPARALLLCLRCVPFLPSDKIAPEVEACQNDDVARSFGRHSSRCKKYLHSRFQTQSALPIQCYSWTATQPNLWFRLSCQPHLKKKTYWNRNAMPFSEYFTWAIVNRGRVHHKWQLYFNLSGHGASDEPDERGLPRGHHFGWTVWQEQIRTTPLPALLSAVSDKLEFSGDSEPLLGDWLKKAVAWKHGR